MLQSLNLLQVAQTEANRSNRKQREANTSKRKQNYAQINTKVFSLPHCVFIRRRCLGAVESEGLFQNEASEAGSPQIPKLVRCEYKLESSETLKVTVTIVGFLGVRESFLAECKKWANTYSRFDTDLVEAR